LFLKIFMNTLKYLQSNEFLLDVDLWRLFANLEELNKVRNRKFKKCKLYLDQKPASPIKGDEESTLRFLFRFNTCN